MERERAAGVGKEAGTYSDVGARGEICGWKCAATGWQDAGATAKTGCCAGARESSRLGAMTENLPMPSGSLLEVIQFSITPVILLSGVGALMITLTNRMGRVVDRTRSLAGVLRKAPADESEHVEGQLAILWRRAKLIRRAVTYAGLSMLLSCVLVMGIFAAGLMKRDFGIGLLIVFVASVVCLIASLVAFLRDIWMSLHALELEVAKARGR